MNRGRSQGWGARAAAKPEPVKAGSQRAEWQRAISEGRVLALAGSMSLQQRATFLKGSVRGLVVEGFPVEAGHASRLMAESFLKACDAFEIATGDRKQQFAAAVGDIAKALDRVLTDTPDPKAEAVRARYGERA